MLFTRPALLLRIEEFAILYCAVFLYRQWHFNWWLFTLLFLLPDLFMFGYIINAYIGAALYNTGHALFIPITLFVAGYVLHWPIADAIALIWIAHIAFDRLLGYGLKYPSHFKDTHLQHLE